MMTKEDVERILWIAKAFNAYKSRGVGTATAYGFAEALYEEHSEDDPVGTAIEDLTQRLTNGLISETLTSL